MNNNDILRRLRYTFEYGDAKMINVFKHAKLKITREQLSNWLKKEDNPDFKACTDKELATFLNGLIIEKRGKKDGPQPVAEERLTNNIVFTKLKIALNLRAEEVIDVLSFARFNISKHELSAFFRKPGNRHYRPCQDQVLRKFLKGLQLKHRPANSDEADVKAVKFEYNYKPKKD